MLNIGGLYQGVVIDHIQAGAAMKIYEYLNLDEIDACVAIIKNAKSNKMGKKDIIKIEGPNTLDLDMLAMVFGFFLLALAGYNFFVAGKLTIRANWKSALVCSAISGAFGGLFGIGGPLMSLYYLDATHSKEAYSANMQGLFALSCINGMSNRIACGLYTAELILPSVVGIVFVCVGSRLGLKLLDKLDAQRLKQAVYLCVAASGAVTVLGHLPF